jgi:cell division protein FtsI/penicillin-binding protein 2
MKKVSNMKNIPIIRMTVSKAIVVAFIIAIITLFGSGVFNITQAQTPSAPSSPSPSPSPTKTALPPAIKAKICDPNNPKLAFVNTTESNICGLPKSIKNITTTTTTTTPTPTLTPKPITPPSSPKPITPPSSPKPITPPSSPKPITPPSEPSPPAEDIPGLP